MEDEEIFVIFSGEILVEYRLDERFDAHFHISFVGTAVAGVWKKADYYNGVLHYKRAKTRHSRSDEAYMEMRVLEQIRVTVVLGYGSPCVTERIAAVFLVLVGYAHKGKVIADTSVRKKSFCYTKAARHKGEPLGMAITIFTIYIRVVIDKVLVAGVVRGIYIDNINFALMGIGESGQGPLRSRYGLWSAFRCYGGVFFL